MSDIKDISLAPSGRDKIEWVRSYMPVLNRIRADFEKTKPFAGLKISMSIHLEAKTAYLAKVLRAGGAEVFVTGCNPLSTQDDVAAALAAEGFTVHAHHGATAEQYQKDLIATLSCCPDLIIDDGGDFISALSAKVCLDQESAYYTSPAFNGSSGFFKSTLSFSLRRNGCMLHPTTGTVTS